ncbi:MAG: hydrolase [marine bacterium B5-7]|nr:MAG: hydrolase [marine bacterium B5-7]
MREVHAISFDLDDSLWAIMPVILRAEQVMHERLAERFPEITRRYDFEAVRLVRMQVVEKHPHLAHDLSELRRLCFVELLKECGYDEVHADDLIHEFLELRHDVELFEDVVPSLERLSSHYRLITLSNGNADVDRLGIGNYFEIKVSARSEGVAKPDTRIFHAACQALDLNPGEVLHVGDHPVDDVRGARDAGFKTAWLNRDNIDWTETFRPDMICADLNELCTRVLDEEYVDT